MISVSQALDHLFAKTHPLDTEDVPLTQALGRTLRAPVFATRAQPPFAASAMDGYAVADVVAGDVLPVIGEAAAGHGFRSIVTKGQAVRIFTGAPVPEGANRVIIQEDVTRIGDTITVNSVEQGRNIRPAGNDFPAGHRLDAPCVLGPNDIALIAAMNAPCVSVTRKPVVAILSTGDELTLPGDTPGPDQITASNTYGLHALLSTLGADARLLPIARDTRASLRAAFDLTQGADLIVTIGGASVGDHDLVADVTQELGMQRAFYKVAMRPGKPLMAGQMGDALMIGLPGNPVSAMVCGHVFVAPVIRAMLGQGAAAAPRLRAVLAQDIAENGPREHYMRASLRADGLRLHDRQDSALLSVLGASNALAIRPVGDPARKAGDLLDYLPI